MPYMQERGRYVDSVLDPQRPAGGEPAAQVIESDHVCGRAEQSGELAEEIVHG
jgi:hypothetical protein